MSFKDDLAGIPEQLQARLHVEGGALIANAPLIVCGMGGSAAAGDFVALSLQGRREITMLREAALPARVLGLIVLSYSGETEESLSVWHEARARGVPRAAVTSGGALWRAAEAESCPRVRLPGGLAPRNALGYLMTGMRCLAGEPGQDAEWPEASAHLASIRGCAGTFGAVLECLEATEVPVLLAGDAATVCAARRWRASLAENAKVAATIWELPEAAHNRIVSAGKDGPRRRSLGLVALGTPRETRARQRWDAVLAALEAHGAEPLRVNVPHAVSWIEAVGLAYLGDWMSLGLAERLGVDPEPLALMADVKSRLRQ